MAHIRCPHGQFPHCERCDKIRLEKDETDLQLVQKQAVTLADLYRKAQASGLVLKRSTYQ